MGAAERISCEEMRARHQRDIVRQALHSRFDEWLDGLESQLAQPAPPLAQVSETVWTLRPALTGGLTETIVAHTHRQEDTRQQTPGAPGGRLLTARTPVARTVETMVGPVTVERPSLYCRTCREGPSPVDAVLGVVAGCPQLAIPHAAVPLATEVPSDTAPQLCGPLTGLHGGSERLHAVTTQVGAALTVLDVAPSRQAIGERIAALAAGRLRRPVLGLGMDGASVATRPDSARQPCAGRRNTRARRATGRGQWRAAQGVRFSRLDGERIVPRRSGHQGHNEAQRGAALTQSKDAGLLPEDQGRLCVVCDGAAWIWKPVSALLPQARQGLDAYHCAH